jgi:cathepsin L
MKTQIVFCLAFAATLALSKSPFQEQWSQFKLTHNKEYSSPIEEIRRQLIFKDNVAKIAEHNAKYNKGEVTYSKAMNQFGDMSKEEFLAYVNRGKAQKPKIPENLRMPYVSSKKPLAASVDWRSRAVTEVKDQGQCGSCWSFSATGALEGQLALRAGRNISLSEQNLIDCSADYGNDGCDGGWMDSAFSYIHDYGIMSESSYPYEAQVGYCRYNNSQSEATVIGYYDLRSGDEGSLAYTVEHIGPVAVAIDATDELQFYSGGIFHDQTCNQSDLNHGVLVVGYGSEYDQDYWILKNSWGSGWGESGYWRQVRNYGNNCGIATAASYPDL